MPGGHFYMVDALANLAHRLKMRSQRVLEIVMRLLFCVACRSTSGNVTRISRIAIPVSSMITGYRLALISDLYWRPHDKI